MDSVSRRYYEKELGAGIGPSVTLKGHFGYTEPLRRFIQREEFEPQANEIPNTMPSWMPGDDYLTNFRVGDPYTKIDQGFARMPGAGYAAIHPELEGVNPEDYPDIHKMAILADVAPYSREYNIFRQAVDEQSLNNTELRIEYEKLLERVRKTMSLRPAATKQPRTRAEGNRTAGAARSLDVRPQHLKVVALLELSLRHQSRRTVRLLQRVRGTAAQP
jgi:hypothetical protein